MRAAATAKSLLETLHSVQSLEEYAVAKTKAALDGNARKKKNGNNGNGKRKVTKKTTAKTSTRTPKRKKEKKGSSNTFSPTKVKVKAVATRRLADNTVNNGNGERKQRLSLSQKIISSLQRGRGEKKNKTKTKKPTIGKRTASVAPADADLSDANGTSASSTTDAARRFLPAAH